MALAVTGNFDTPFGTTVPSTYWRWVGLGIDVTTSACTAVLYAYVDEAAFSSGKANIGQKTYQLTGTDFATFVLGTPNGANLSDVVSNAIYAYVQAQDPFFAGAASV